MEEVSKEMSKGLEKELLEVAQWYTYFKSQEMSIEKRMEFLTKAIDFLLWTLARTVEDMRDIEGRTKNGHELADPYLFKAVPKSIRTAT